MYVDESRQPYVCPTTELISNQTVYSHIDYLLRHSLPVDHALKF